MNATTSVPVMITLDPTIAVDDLAAAIKVAVAAELRKLADELAPEKDAPAPAPRFRLALDNAEDYVIRDTVTGLIADYRTEYSARVAEDVAKLNSGELAPRDLPTTRGISWKAEADLYPPYREVTE